jgi:hypothetical protein
VFIDELMGRGPSGPDHAFSLYTIITKAADDSPDPDTVRGEPAFCNYGIATTITRAPELNDPDLARADAMWAMTTSFTNGRRDKPDPDWLRRD